MAWERLKQLVYRKKELPGGLWMRCDACNKMVFKRKVEELYKICPECGFHYSMTADERIKILLDKNSFVEKWTDLESTDPLEFRAKDSYPEKIKSSQKRSGLRDACVTGTGTIFGRTVAFGLTDSRFLMGSMGSVVGEKLTRLIELGCQERLPVIIVSGSGGGARMYEGAISLMQMAKTSAALARLQEARGLFVSILTHPTMAGVLASFASLGDFILAEPGALIGFTGPRVIAATTKTELPPGFQSSEFLLEHGFLDRVVHRTRLRRELVKILSFCCGEYDETALRQYEQTDMDEHDAWVQAHGTQRMDSTRHIATDLIKPGTAPLGDSHRTSDTIKSTTATPRHRDVDHELLDPSGGTDTIDIVDT